MDMSLIKEDATKEGDGGPEKQLSPKLNKKSPITVLVPQMTS
jgi:hypothetical protein